MFTSTCSLVGGFTHSESDLLLTVAVQDTHLILHRDQSGIRAASLKVNVVDVQDFLHRAMAGPDSPYSMFLTKSLSPECILSLEYSSTADLRHLSVTTSGLLIRVHPETMCQIVAQAARCYHSVMALLPSVKRYFFFCLLDPHSPLTLF